MIYDPRCRALELRQVILESMTAEHLEEYAKPEVRRVAAAADLKRPER